jgi:hypothetical protein
MKVCILAFDGLDYNIVKNLPFKSLKQKVYGFYLTSTDLSSIQFWSAFLTGEQAEKFEKRFVERPLRKFLEKNRLLSKLRPLKPLARKILPPKPPTIKGKHKTIFELTDKPLPYNVLAYNETKEQFKLRWKYNLTSTLGNKEKCEEAISKWTAFCVKQSQKFLQLLKTEEWKLAMTHFFFTDLVNHYSYGQKSELNHSHLLADRIAFKTRETLEKMGERYVLLIVSDHGSEKGLHTPYGFYSLNINTDWKPSKITEFYPKISEWLEKNG